MNNLTLRQMRYSEALARLGHFGRAAEVCSVSQPALSVQIKEMEQALDAQLFERAARKVRLTRLGEEIAPRIAAILRSVDDLADLTRAARADLTGLLRLGVIPTIAPYLLPRIVGELALSHPGLDLQIRETMTEKLIRELRDSRLDAAIVALPVSEPSLTEVALFDESFMLVRPEGDADQPVPDAKALSQMQLLLLEEGHCFRDQALSFCSLRSSLPRESLDGSSLSTLVQMVGAGIGVTLIPEMAAAVETRSAAVSVVRFASPQPTRTVGMVWRKSNPLADHLERVAQSVKEAGLALQDG